jgi:hypothetical protein
MSTTEAIERCACGEPLHYASRGREAMVRFVVAEKGEYIPVTMGGITYRVQRHFVALHGLKAEELPELARRGIVRVDDT